MLVEWFRWYDYLVGVVWYDLLVMWLEVMFGRKFGGCLRWWVGFEFWWGICFILVLIICFFLDI